MKFNKDLIQWKKDKKQNAEDPHAVIQRRKNAILEELRSTGEPAEERHVYKAIREHFSAHQDYFLMLQGLIKDKLVGVKPIQGKYRRRRYFIKEKG
jgi:hypothetical protein